MTDMREKFEAWAVTVGLSITRMVSVPDAYTDVATFEEWETWQAAWNARADAGTVDRRIVKEMTEVMSHIHHAEELIFSLHGHYTKDYNQESAPLQPNHPEIPDSSIVGMSQALCEDCPPVGYPTNKTRCASCPKNSYEEIEVDAVPNLLVDEFLARALELELKTVLDDEHEEYLAKIVDLSLLPEDVTKIIAALRHSRKRDLELIEWMLHRTEMENVGSSAADILQAYEERKG